MCFQSIALLSERGRVEDVCSLCRTLLQVRFRLAAITKSPEGYKRILASAQGHRAERARKILSGKLKVPEDFRNVDWGKLLADIGSEFEQFGRSQANDKELMELGGCELDRNAYLILSDAAHASWASVKDLCVYENGSFKGFVYGPHDRELVPMAGYAANLPRKSAGFAGVLR
jgi:Family of unknown function (DUF5677)